MKWLTRERAGAMLSDLIARPSVNPMGRLHSSATPVERGVVEYVEGLFAGRDARVTRLPVSDVHENLLIEYPADGSGPGILFESHMDVVPADDWADEAFVPRREGDLLIGRGACDDKGSLTAMILALLDLIETGERPPRPVLLLCAGDEEYAQTGIKSFCGLPFDIRWGIFGEPTRLEPVVQHKGTLRWDFTVHGRSAHTSRPELGANAILGAIGAVEALSRLQKDLQRRFASPLMTGPLLTVSMIRGGRTRNAVPDECVVSVDFRLLPGMDMQAARSEAMAVIDDACSRTGEDLRATHSDLQLRTPALSTPLDHPFSRQTLEICRTYAGPEVDLRGEPYGTDAAWVADRAAALVLGPGDIRSAHAVGERIDLNEVVTCARIYRAIMTAPPSQLTGPSTALPGGVHPA